MHFLFALLLAFSPIAAHACSVVYYADSSGNVYVVNHEDYYLDTKAELHIIPKKANSYALAWYGWKDFAQGGVNEHGLFFDGATTPPSGAMDKQQLPKGNFGTRLLGQCKNVAEALQLIDSLGVVLHDSHIMLGDSTGKAVVVEWIGSQQQVIPIRKKVLAMTNYMLTSPKLGNYPCPRYRSIQEEMTQLPGEASLLEVGQATAKAVQPATTLPSGQQAGTLYSTFIDLKQLSFILVYKLDNERKITLNLAEAFRSGKQQKYKLDKL